MTQATVNHAIARSIADLVTAAMTEARDGWEYEDTLARVEMAGYLDGMTQMAILLGFEVVTKGSEELTLLGRGYIEKLANA
jgi:hypothetical protein